MNAVLSPAHYLRQDVFECEQARLFGRLWIFACMASSVDSDQAYAARRVAGLPVLVINQNGHLSAYENRCPHRSMPLKPEGFGQGRMVCPYHGWVFNEVGRVKTIPKEPLLYQFEPEERESLCLRKVAVERVGGLIFVNLDPMPIPITQQFSAQMLKRLTDISAHFGDVAMHTEIEAAYNWKLNYENVLDSEHIPYIHPRTFLPLIKKAHPDNQDDPPTAPLLHPQPTACLTSQSWFSEMPMKVQAWPWHQLVNAFGEPDTYHNHFLFPNINFISVGGVVFLIQQFEPLAADRTQVRFTLCVAGSNGRIPALPAILRGHMNSEVQVLMEDVVHLERLQSQLHEGAPQVRHGRYEHALASFGLAYLDWMNEQRPL